MERTLISMRDVNKRYGTFNLGPVDWEIEPGYVIAIVGPNGSGKTTLFRMLMNLIAPASGEIELFGQRYPDAEVEIKQRIGYIPESPIGYEEMSPAALADFVSYWYPNWDQSRYDALLAQAGIPVSKPYGELSKGMQRRVSFALARASSADLLLLDEPSAGLDPFARREMIDEISNYMQEDGRTVLMATHSMEEVRRLSDYIALIQGGDFIGFYEKDALLEQWRTLWIDREPPASMPGVVRIDPGTPVRIVTNNPVETEQELDWEGIEIIRRGPVDLEEILEFLMQARVTK
jgi:ABC-2 type transport system ATP-binding protein